MKKVLLAVGVIILAGIGYIIYMFATTKSHSPKDIVTVNGSGLEISVEYCRPYKKEREIFGSLVPYDTYWRTGANDATEISFSKDVLFGGKSVSAGRYRLYTIPSEGEWEVVLNSQLGEWGYFEPDYTLDVERVEVPVQTTDNIVEQFTISIDSNGNQFNLNMVWDQTRVTVPISKQ